MYSETQISALDASRVRGNLQQRTNGLEALPLKGYTMKRKVVELGSASAKTKDFTGFNWWDSFLWDWRKWTPYG